MDMYKKELIDHYRNPCHKGIIENADFTSHQLNPACGDQVSFTGKLLANIMTDIAFTGSGCVISLGAASLLAQKCKDTSVHDIMNIATQDMCNLIGLDLGPVRLKCALLPLQALQEGISAYLRKK